MAIFFSVLVHGRFAVMPLPTEQPNWTSPAVNGDAAHLDCFLYFPMVLAPVQCALAREHGGRQWSRWSSTTRLLSTKTAPVVLLVVASIMVTIRICFHLNEHKAQFVEAPDGRYVLRAH
jgi:hypothetical protein